MQSPGSGIGAHHAPTTGAIEPKVDGTDTPMAGGGPGPNGRDGPGVGRPSPVGLGILALEAVEAVDNVPGTNSGADVFQSHGSSIIRSKNSVRLHKWTDVPPQLQLKVKGEEKSDTRLKRMQLLRADSSWWAVTVGLWKCHLEFLSMYLCILSIFVVCVCGCGCASFLRFISVQDYFRLLPLPTKISHSNRISALHCHWEAEPKWPHASQSRKVTS